MIIHYSFCFRPNVRQCTVANQDHKRPPPLFSNPMQAGDYALKKDVAVIIDSGCAPTPEMIKRDDLEFIGIRINLDDRQYEDGVSLKKNDFYNRIGRARDFSTSPPSPKEILDKYRSIKDKGYRQIIDIHFSSKMTELVKNSHIAKDFITGLDVHIIDTESVSAGA